MSVSPLCCAITHSCGGLLERIGSESDYGGDDGARERIADVTRVEVHDVDVLNPAGIIFDERAIADLRLCGQLRPARCAFPMHRDVPDLEPELSES